MCFHSRIVAVKKVRAYVRDEANAGAVQSKIAISFYYFTSAVSPASEFPGASLLVRNTIKGGNKKNNVLPDFP